MSEVVGVVYPEVLMYQPVIQEIYVERCKSRARPSTVWVKDLKVQSSSETEFGNKVQHTKEKQQYSGRCRYPQKNQETSSRMSLQLPQHDSNTSFNGSDLRFRHQSCQETKSSVPEMEGFGGSTRVESSKNCISSKNDNIEDANHDKPPELLQNTVNDYVLYSDCGCLYTESDNTLNDLSERESGLDADYSNFYSYSQSQLHYLSEAESLKFVSTSKDSIHVYRIEKLRKKIMATLDEIQGLIYKIPMHDGVEDLKRRQQRAAEFSARFCRNYLYQLRRQINDIRKLLRNTCYNPKQNPPHPILSQKMVTAHQNAWQALQAYLHHMPCSVQGGLPDKLQELLHVVKDLCGFCSELGVTYEGERSDAVDVVEEKCINILGHIDCVNEMCNFTSSNSVKKMQKNVDTKSTMKNPVLTAKEVFLKPKRIYFPKPSKLSQGCRNKKLNTHRGNKEKLEKIVLSKQPGNTHHLPVSCEDSSFKKKKNIREFYAEDDIPTMMEYFPVEHQDEDSLIQVHTVKKSQPSCPTEKLPEKCAPEREQKGNVNILQSIEGDIKTMQEDMTILRNKNHPNYTNYKQILEKLHTCLLEMRVNKQAESSTLKEEKKPKQNRRKKLTHVEGEKNVKLICLPPADDLEGEEDASSSHAGPALGTKFTNFTYHLSVPSSGREEKTNQKQGNSLISSAYEEEENVSDERIQLLNYEAHYKQQIEKPTKIEASSSNWEHENVEELCDLRNNKIFNCISTIDIKNNPSEGDSSMGATHPNTPNSGYFLAKSKERTSNLSKTKHIPVTLCMCDEERSSFLLYQKEFHNFLSAKSLYVGSRKPWIMLSRIADKLIYDTLHEVLNDIGICKITSGLLELEFL